MSDIFTITKRVVFFRKVTNNQRVSQILLVNNVQYKKKYFHLRLFLNVNEFNYIFTELLFILIDVFSAIAELNI